MICKVCGKELGEDVKFCSNCGAKVIMDTEAEKDRETLGFVDNTEAEPAQKVFHGYAQPEENFEEKLAATKNIKFDWELDDVNSTRDIENVNFNWNELAENEAPKKQSLEEEKDSVFTEEDIYEGEPVNFDWSLGTTTHIEKSDDGETDKKCGEENLVSQSKEASADGEAPQGEPKKKNIDKFYTFNKKNEEFQALLDEEYERLRKRIKEENEAENVIRDKQEKLEKARDKWENAEFEPVTDDEPLSDEAAEECENANQAEEVTEPKEAEEQPEAEKETVEADAAEEGEVVKEESEEASAETESAEDAVHENPEECVDADTKEEVCEEPAEENQKAVKEELNAEKTSVNHLEGSFAQVESGIVAICQPIGTTIADLSEPEAEEEAPVEVKKTVDKATKRITYRDIFADDEEEEEKPAKGKKKKSEKEGETKGGKPIVLNVILLILLIVMIISGIMAFAPNSTAGKFFQGNFDKVKSVFAKENPAKEEKEEKTELELAIKDESSKNKNIEKIEAAPDLRFSYSDDYGVEGLSESAAFVNGVWYTDSEKNTINYGDAIVGDVISYYSALVDNRNEGSKDILSVVDESSELHSQLDAQEKSSEKYGINLLKIGEVRVTGDNYYVLVKVVERIGDGNITESLQIVQLKAADKQMKITAVTAI